MIVGQFVENEKKKDLCHLLYACLAKTTKKMQSNDNERFTLPPVLENADAKHLELVDLVEEMVVELMENLDYWKAYREQNLDAYKSHFYSKYRKLAFEWPKVFIQLCFGTLTNHPELLQKVIAASRERGQRGEASAETLTNVREALIHKLLTPEQQAALETKMEEYQEAKAAGKVDLESMNNRVRVQGDGRIKTELTADKTELKEDHGTQSMGEAPMVKYNRNLPRRPMRRAPPLKPSLVAGQSAAQPPSTTTTKFAHRSQLIGTKTKEKPVRKPPMSTKERLKQKVAQRAVAAAAAAETKK